MVDNPDTLLVDSDFVFYDAMETGFSRPATPDYAPEFLNTKGDVAVTAEFIRAYRARFPPPGSRFSWRERVTEPIGQPPWRIVERTGPEVAGAMLLSGDIPNIPMPVEFYDAMHVPARAATAFFYHRLPPELMQDREATLREVDHWVTTVYLPALEHPDKLNDTERDKIAHELARYIGMPRKTSTGKHW